MVKFSWENDIQAFDERRDVIIPGNAEETVLFCVKQFIEVAQQSIKERGRFVVALSGGSTPNAIFKQLSQPTFAQQIEWSKVFLFWSDERSVPPQHAESNYRMAMDAGLSALPLPPDHIFRMQAEEEIEENARRYEQYVLAYGPFDLLMLGMGEDGHTASLFPKTHGLHANQRLVIANHVPQKNTWRMSMTYECIHQARLICIYVIGKNKADTIAKIFTHSYEPDLLPIQKVGTPTHKALWILDTEAAERLVQLMK